MLNPIIKFILIFLSIFTPIAFGSMELWSFSLMELGILLIIILRAIQSLSALNSDPRGKNSPLRTPNSLLPIVVLFLFLLLVLFQMLPLPSGILKIISPKTFELRHQLLIAGDPLRMTPLSFFPFVTQIEFFKWLTLVGLFFFLLCWEPLRESDRIKSQLIIVIMMVGVLESLYGMFEFFSGHQHILHLKMESVVSSVTGTFINRNYFAGYLLMVIPLSVGFFFSREAISMDRFGGWRHRLSSLDGKTLLIGFAIILMILALLFSASRMGIVSLLFSFSVISLLFRNPQRGERFSKTSVLIFALAFLWAAWIGLDTVVSRFFNVSEGFEERWKIWMNTFQIIKDYPLFGSGLGTFIQVFPMYRTFHIRGLITHSENDFLQLTSEVGLLGIGLLIILFFFLFFRAVSGIRSISHRKSEKYIGIGGLVGIMALMFHSMVERNIQIPANAFLYTVLWALVLRTSMVSKTRIDVKEGF